MCSHPAKDSDGHHLARDRTFRIDPVVKEALRTAAARQHRSIANMVEVLIRDYCGRNGITIAEQGDLLSGKNKD
ncbi:MAG: hypothetical protein CMN28_10060 [Salinisphaeraceae bacterium]|nr:hypothetical protein [Salinisphaeraceae bacterium]